MTRRKTLSIAEALDGLKESPLVKKARLKRETREKFESNPEEQRRREDEKAREYSWRLVQDYWGHLPVKYCYKHDPEITFVKPGNTKDPRKISVLPKGVRDSIWIDCLRHGNAPPIKNDTTLALPWDCLSPSQNWASRMGSCVEDSFGKDEHNAGKIVGAGKVRDRRPEYWIWADANGVVRIPKRDRPDAGPNKEWWRHNWEMDHAAALSMARWRRDDPEAYEAFQQGEDKARIANVRDALSRSLTTCQGTAPGDEADPFAPAAKPMWEVDGGGYSKDERAYMAAVFNDDGPGGDPLADQIDDGPFGREPQDREVGNDGEEN